MLKELIRLKQDTQRNYQLLGSLSNMCFYEYDLKSKQYDFFENVESVLGYDPEELIQFLEDKHYSSNDSLFHPEDMHLLQEAHEKMESLQESYIEARLLCANGQYQWFSINRKLVESEGDQKVVGCISNIDHFYNRIMKLHEESIYEPMTGLINKQKGLKMIKQVLVNYTEQTHAVLFVDLDNFKDINDKYGHIIGDKAIKYVAESLKDMYSENNIVVRFGGDEFIIFSPNITSRNRIVRKANRMLENINQYKISLQTEEKLTASIGITFTNGNVDVQEIIDRADKALYVAKQNGKSQCYVFGADHIDPADSTLFGGICRRKEFLKIVDENLPLSKGKMCLVAINLEHFRFFNQWYGTAAGDDLLFEIADYLASFQKMNDSLAGYFHDDDFAIFMPNDKKLLKKLEKECCDIVLRKTKAVGFLPLFGIFEIQNIDLSAHQMYNYALEALRTTYGNYLVRSCVYTPDMTSAVEKEMRIINEFDHALKTNQIMFYLQPKVDICSKKIVGAEVLTRWKHPKLGMIPPGDFIPILEKNGFISNLDVYIWDKVCERINMTRKQGGIPVPVSINVSQIDMISFDIAQYLKELTEKYEIDKNLLRVEITESAYIENVDRMKDTINKLHDYGFSVFMDDFGTGYSSLNIIRNIEVDAIKVGVDFLDFDSKEEEKSLLILESIISLAHSMNLPVIIEGVENQKQEDYLHELNCHFAQGYYYYRPMPLEDFLKLKENKELFDVDGVMGIWNRRDSKKQK